MFGSEYSETERCSDLNTVRLRGVRITQYHGKCTKEGVWSSNSSSNLKGMTA